MAFITIICVHNIFDPPEKSLEIALTAYSFQPLKLKKNLAIKLLNFFFFAFT